MKPRRLACWRAVLLAGVLGNLAFAAETQVGPANGTLVVVGGGGMRKLWPVFLELAGGKDAPIVVIPTANETVRDDDPSTQALRALGATRVTVLHTREPSIADTEEFTAPLRSARAVWFTGGRQWRLVDAYLNTRTQREIAAVLARGGVVGGSSAGATIQGSYLVRGAPSGNTIMMSPGHEEGFALFGLFGMPPASLKWKVRTSGADMERASAIFVHRDKTRCSAAQPALERTTRAPW